MDGIPPAAKTDAEDVVWALQTADALWKRHERVDAIVWLRRAAQAAAESHNDDRALSLARSAAELSEFIARNPSPPGRASRPEGMDELAVEEVEPIQFDDEMVTNSRVASARSLAAISGEVPVPAELRAATVSHAGGPGANNAGASQERERLELPKRVAPPSSSQRRAAPPPLPPRRPPIPPLPPQPPMQPRLPEPTINVEEEELLPSANLKLLEDDDEDVESVPTQDAPPRPAAALPVPSLEPEPESEAEPAPSSALTFLPASEPEPEASRSSAFAMLPGPEPEPDPDLPTDAAVFDSVTQKIKADLRALDVSARRSVADDNVTPPAPAIPAASLPPAPSLPSGPELTVAETSPPPLDLSSLEAFADLPDDAREAFAAAAEVHELHADEETAGFALAVVIEGEVDVCAAIADAAGERLGPGAVLRMRGSVGPDVAARFVCASDHAKVATWNLDAVEEAFRTCPWVENDLCSAANRTHALVGSTMGPLGERLDAMLRKQITDRLEVRPLEPGDVLVSKGQPVPGVILVGTGYLEVVREDGTVIERVSSGQFLFSSSILGGGAAPATARASTEGTIVLFGDRMVAHELLLTCPPLLEVLAGM
ncbi:cyclic nucleotide-binding domain-containing protein [Pendulispora brunnea]|uniref:Cyclic nucleotide-binding domain-containing protein n=1 Tax=Pendulispora brunnea TaxID=2905690 RepID=A0ABZ2KNR3_9BACT